MLKVLSPVQAGDMTVRVEPDYDFRSAEYRAFYAPDRATAFQAPLWLAMLHERLVPALGATQHTITVRHRSGALAAVLPMVRQRASGISMLMPADFGVCDYNSIVGDRAALTTLACDEHVLQELKDALSGADLLLFRKVRADDFDVSLLLGRTRSTQGENAAYTCPTGLDPDEFRLKVLRRKFTKELGRLQRQTERTYGSYTHRLLTDEAEIRAAFDFLRAREGARDRNAILLRQPYFEFYRDYALAGAASGEALTYASHVGDQLGAILFGPAGDGEMHCVLIQSDTDAFERISPGIQLLYRVALMRMAQGHSRFDMGLGDTGYKQHFRVEATQMQNHSRALSPTGAAAGLIYHKAKPLKNVLRAMVPHVR